MPLYIFKCQKCSTELEKLIPIKDRDVVEIFCPKCTHKTKRQISSPAPPIFKGKYENMYSRQDVNNATPADVAEMTKDIN